MSDPIAASAPTASAGQTEERRLDVVETALAISASGSAVALSPPATVQSGTTYTVDSDDNNTSIGFSNASQVTVTIPTGLTVGSRGLLFARGAGGLTLSTSGLTLWGSSPNTTISQNEGIYWEIVATDTLMVIGGTA